MSSNYFPIVFIPIILAQIICRLYLLRHLDKPADFKEVPWYVRLSLGSTAAKLVDFKETSLIYLLGSIVAGVKSFVPLPGKASLLNLPYCDRHPYKVFICMPNCLAI
jgi:hypothetical protein